MLHQWLAPFLDLLIVLQPNGSLTEINEYSHQRHNRQHNDKNYTPLGALLGLPVELTNGVAVQEKHKTTVKFLNKSFNGIQTGCLGGPAWGTEPNSTQYLWYTRIQHRIVDFSFL